MIYLLIALLHVFVPVDMNRAKITENGNEYYTFVKSSDSTWKGTNSRGKQFNFTIGETTVQEDMGDSVDVIKRLDMNGVTKISDLINIGDLQRGDVAWRLERIKDGVSYSMGSGDFKEPRKIVYAITYSKE